MTVTTRHPESKFGVPVVLDEEGRVLDTCHAVRFFRRYYGLTSREFGQMTNATSNSVIGWECGRTAIPVSVLLVIKDFLEDEKERVMRGGLITGKIRSEMLQKRLDQSGSKIASAQRMK